MITVSHFVAGVFRHNITLILPVLVLLFKFAVRWMTREPLKDVFKSLLTVPLDFVYIAAGILFAGLARRLPQFAAKYNSDREADLYGAIFLILLFLVGAAITQMDRGVRVCWQKAFAAAALMKDSPQIPLPTGEPPLLSDKHIGIWMWLLFYWLGMMLLFIFECALSVVALGGILERVT